MCKGKSFDVGNGTVKGALAVVGVAVRPANGAGFLRRLTRTVSACLSSTFTFLFFMFFVNNCTSPTSSMTAVDHFRSDVGS